MLGRIKRLHIVAAGAVIFIGLLVGFAFGFLQPIKAEMKTVQESQQQAETTWRQLPAKVAALGEAQQNLAQAEADKNAFMARMPKVNIDDPFEAMFDLHRVFKNDIGQPIYRFFRSIGYEASISVPGTPMQPQQVPPMWVFNWSLSPQFRSFPAALDFLGKLKDIPYPGVISGISISGTSPKLSVNMPLTVYVLTERAFAAGPPAAAPGPAAPAVPGMAPGQPPGAPVPGGLRLGRREDD